MTARCPICNAECSRSFPSLYGRQPAVAGVPIALPARPGIVLCDVCGARWTSPPPPADALAKCYAEAETGVWFDDEDTAVRRGFDARVERLETLAPQSSLLEVGCYTGGFLRRVPKSWERVGLEPSVAAAEEARRHGIEVFAEDLFEASLPEAHFGAAAAFDVIEHLTEPDEFVDRLRRWLVPGGIFLLETGDCDSPFARLMGRYWSYYHLPEHVLFYSPQSVRRLLERHDFEIVEVERGHHSKRPLWGMHARRAVVAAGYAMGSELVRRSLGASLASFRVPWLLHRDHMLVWARKRRNRGRI